MPWKAASCSRKVFPGAFLEQTGAVTAENADLAAFVVVVAAVDASIAAAGVRRWAGSVAVVEQWTGYR